MYTITETEYSPFNQPIRITDPLGNTTHISYDYRHINKYGQTVLQKTKTDPLGQRTIITYDTHNKEASLEKYSPYNSLIAKEERLYDPCERLIRSTHTIIIPGKSAQHTTTIRTYNQAGQLLSLTEALGTAEEKKTHHSYNRYGQKEKTTKPDGVQLFHTYDPLGRLSTISSSDQTIAYQYTYNRNDQPIRVEDKLNHTTTHRTYNTHGEITQETLANNLTLNYDYDQQGRLQTLILPDNTAVTYNYDAAFLRQVTYQHLSHQYLDYDLSGNLLHSRSPTGDITYTYDKLHRTTDIQAPNFSETAITYDPVGNLINRYDRQRYCEYQYDDLYQLQNETGIAEHNYSYDSLNNRRTKDHISHEINALNQLLSQGNTQYKYNPNGNLIAIEQDKKITCRYDALDRLTTLTIDDKTIHYTYDAFNRRLTRKSDTEIAYLYASKKEIGSYENHTLKELRILGSGLGAETGAVALYLQNNWYIPTHDHNGNVTTLSTPTGQLIESYTYTAFGEEADPTSTLNPWHFASKRKDPDTNWIAFGRRDYDPALGRWLTPDPLGFEDGPNLYAYLHNSPLTHIDLWGLAALGTAGGSVGYDFSYKQDYGSQLGNMFYNTLSNPYFQGGLQTYGGFMEASFGCGLVSTGVFAPLGCMLIAHGLDHAATGMSTLYSGIPKESLTSQLLQTAGMSPQAANITDGAIGMAGTMKATATLARHGAAMFATETATNKITVPTFAKKIATNENKFSLDMLSKSGQAIDREGLTKAGRALDKHGGRPNSAFPKATGNVASKNAQGQYQLDDILTHPNGYIKQNKYGGIDFYRSDGSGARFNGDQFKGFLEPNL